MISMTPFFFLVLLAAVENAVIPTDDTDNRIFGGEDASITEFPSMAFLDIYVNVNKSHVCGSTIISDRWVLTAGHCVQRVHVSNVELRVGSANRSDGRSVHQASRIISHEEFLLEIRNGTLVDVQNDIAVVEVEEPFPLNDFTIKAARLPLQDEDIPPGTPVTAVGWGRIEKDERTDILQKANMKIMNAKYCKKDIPQSVSFDIRNVCAADPREGKQTCRGDSGGPLFFDDMVVGVNSYGGPCERSEAGNAFTNVAYFRDWITQKTGI